MRTIRLFVIVVFSFFLIACATNQINHHQLSFLNKNMPRDEVIRRFERTPAASGEVNTKGRNILFDRYAMNNGIQIDWYFLAYESNRLLYWGYASEFRKHGDPVLNEAIEQGMFVGMSK